MAATSQLKRFLLSAGHIVDACVIGCLASGLSRQMLIFNVGKDLTQHQNFVLSWLGNVNYEKTTFCRDKLMVGLLLVTLLPSV